ncbi:hypothetical protein [Seonamhaeicola marinus]|uniref:Uncharacterized protein n=1 Tax=Seonamhaeicola marinus TaxID=1912246 RepID=A0A5D0HF53_9FLAO|nr:hypothetical protein [Seonamhaeicola marinus]TYA69983.1 hypothetical protein FUA24_22095 [Seonamhaeicola marinus]
MEQLVHRVKNIVDICWNSFSAKVGCGLISINKEASMQLQFAYLLKNSLDLAVYNNDESVELELETGIPVNGRLRECDIVIRMTKEESKLYLPIEMKCYKTKTSTGKLRGAQDIFKLGVYEDLQLLEAYENASYASGIQLTMTDSRNFVYPKSKEAKSWDYDISDGHKIKGGINLNTPIGGKPVNVKLDLDYSFKWAQVNNYYFLKLESND